MKWTEAKTTAKKDGTLRAIAAEIFKANSSGSPRPTLYGMFRDRCTELDITVPNRAYWNLLVGSVISSL